MTGRKAKPGSKDYEVGYGRPPKDTQFKPGQSGNPKGRKRKPKSVGEQMRQVLAKRVDVTERGTIKRVSLLEAILRSMVARAAKGDLKAADFALKLAAADEHSERETLDRDQLTANEEAMLDNLMEAILKESNSGNPPTDAAGKSSEADAEREEGGDDDLQ